jgi:FkbM family methyltransferase
MTASRSAITRVSTMKKLIRTLQVNFPGMLEFKFSLMRSVRAMLQRPFEYDFNAIRLFPDLDHALYLDIGANRGQSTDAILMAKDNVQIQIFEPNRLLFSKLKNMFSSDRRVDLYDFGIGDKEMSGLLYVPFFKKWMFDGLASFDREEAAGWLPENIYAFDDSNLTLQTSTCSIRRLDDLDLQPFFIKIDIQGFEYRALLGGVETLRKHTPILLIEAPSECIIEFLGNFGYRKYSFEKNKFVVDKTGELNTFFITSDKLALIGNQHVC